jgi:anthranilate synthase component 2
LFHGLPKTFEVGRYHSWVVNRDSLPDSLEITAEDDLGFIMALQHKTYDIHGVQFHPESVLTPCGAQILENWLNQ